MRRAGLVLSLALGACASLPPPVGAPPGPALPGWTALADGRRDEAANIFAARLAAAPDDAVALFGRATVAFARGESRAALDDDAALLRALAGGAHPEWSDLLAPVAAARVRELFDEIGPAEEARLAAALRPAEMARATALPWPARLELARLAEEIARRDGDPARLQREAAAAGCAPSLVDAGRLGPLAHLDLLAPEPTGPRRTVAASGCHVDLAPALDGRADARWLRAAIEVGAGDYDLVLDDPGEAWLVVDGVSVAHGSARRYGPQVSAARLWLSAGRHELALRVATSPGETRLTLAVFATAPGGSVRFVPPGPAPGPGAARLVAPHASPAPRAGGGGIEALRAYGAAFEADRQGAIDDAASLAAVLAGWPRFAIGAALAGEIARHDPTVPAPFARDSARRRLRAALAADPGLARAWQSLATIELEDDRPRDAIEAAQRARAAAPGWWAPELMLARVLGLRGLGFDAARALSRAEAKASPGGVPCVVLEALRRDAEERRDLKREDDLLGQLARCAGSVEWRVDRARARGQVDAALAMLGTAVALDPERDDLGADRARMLVAAGRVPEAVRELTAWVAHDPADVLRRVRLADAQVAAGQVADARRTIAEALDARPDVADVRRAARALGVPLPLDDQRVDGREAIRAFLASGSPKRATAGAAAAPAVIALDRDVTRVFPTGATMTLTHEIVRVDSKDAIDQFGEITVPAGAEILTLRTHKPDGSTREPEEIAGKETISAPDLQIGDFVEWELLETQPPAAAFAPGFLTDRFYFQSFDAPIARSELTLILPRGLPLQLDARAGAPRPVEADGPGGTRRLTFAARAVPQLFAERSAVPAVEYVPSVRASSGVTWTGWARYLTEELHDAVRVSPAVRALAAKLREGTGGDPARTAAALVDWVTSHIEATDELAVPAGATLARGRGSRVALALALAAELGVRAEPVLARSRLTADPGAPVPPQELDDFADTLVRFAWPGAAAPVFADLRLRHAPFGYVPPGLDGARTLDLADGAFGLAHSRGDDRRTIDMTIRLDERGAGVAVATEDLSGWPALEWAELLDQFGADRDRLREDFEQRWLGVQFPGARLRDLQVDLPRDGSGRIGRARVRYSFVASHLAVPVERAGAGGREMRIAPTFFRSQPGRRFAAEPQRSTALVLGFDVPTRMTATVELPNTARLDAPGLDGDLVVARAGGYRFVEARDVEPGRPNVIVLRRESTLPIMRVAPDQYAGVAADLRRVDGAEQAEIRIRMGGPARGAAVR